MRVWVMDYGLGLGLGLELWVRGLGNSKGRG